MQEKIVDAVSRQAAVPMVTDRRAGTWIGCDNLDPDCPLCHGAGSYVPGTPTMKRGEMGWKD